MDIYVLNKNLEFIGVIDNYVSVIWIVRYYEPGDFELYLPVNDDNIRLLKEDYYLCREQDIDNNLYKNVMIIEKINLKTDIEEGNYLIVSGKCLKSILSRRIIWDQININGNLELGIQQILINNVISPTIAARKINNFVLGNLQNFKDTIKIQSTGTEIATFLKQVCTTYGIGWDIHIDNGNFVFSLYKGVNRSYNQTINPYVVFSSEYDNLLKTEYMYSKGNYKTVALVAGEGEGKARKKKAIGTASGLNRYELFVDARDISSNDGEITTDEYNLLLTERGLERLSDYMITENFEGEIEINSNYILNRDYFLGDIVQVINEYKIETSPRIIEIIDCDDDTGHSIIPTFST